MDFIQEEDRKSIPYRFFQEEAKLIKEGYNPRIDYLTIVDDILEGI